MTEKESTGSEYADAMRGVLERAAEVEQAKGHVVDARVPFLRRPWVVVTAFVTFVGVMLFNVQLNQRGAAAPPLRVEQASAQTALIVAAEAVERYRGEHGSLPENLEQVGLQDLGFDYRPEAGGSFLMGLTVGSTTLVYDSEEGAAGLLRQIGLGPPQPEGNR